MVYDKIANAFTGASMTYDPCQNTFLHVHTLSFIVYAPSIHACRDVTVLRLVGGGTVEEDILQCAQSKLAERTQATIHVCLLLINLHSI